MSHYAALPRAVALAIPITLGAWSAQAADIVQTAEQDGRFNGFLHLLEAAGMAEMLESERPFTVFAPIDEAFDQLPPGVLEWLLTEEGRTALEAVVQSHIVTGAALVAGDLLEQAVEVATLGGGTLAIDGTTGVISLARIEPSVTEVEGPTVVEQTIVATPVSVMVVDAPPEFVGGANRAAAGAEDALMGVAMVVEPDIKADNGVIHGIDLVLLPPEALWSF